MATWNVHEGISANGATPHDPASFWDALRDAEVDVAALQEVPISASGEIGDLKLAADLAGLPNVVVFPLSASCLREGELSGLALLSRYPFRDEQQAKLPNPRLSHDHDGAVLTSYDKGLLSAVIDWNANSVRVVSLHAPPFHRFGRAADEFGPIWAALARSIGTLADQPLLVGGDFNTGRRELLTEQLNGWLHRAIGVRNTHLNKSTDDILYTDEFEPVNSQVISTQSDHALCLAEFEPSSYQ
jgi:endonuclease/exonuclease/phosphatase family metal-dependent hydrolase